MALWATIDTLEGKPKFLTNTEKEQAYFVDRTEAAIARDQGWAWSKPGWWLIGPEYTDSSGNPRRKAELLIPMDVTAAVAGNSGYSGNFITSEVTITSANISDGAGDITDLEVGDDVTLTCTAVASINGWKTEWSVDDGGGFDVIPDETGRTLTLSNVPASIDGNVYKARVYTDIPGIAPEIQATSNSLTAGVTVTYTGSIVADDNSVTAGEDITFTLTSTSSTDPYVIQWQRADSLTPTVWVDINGENEDTYVLTTALSDNGDLIRVHLSNVDTSDVFDTNSITLTVV